MTTETGPDDISSRFAREARFLCPGPTPRGIGGEPQPCLEPLPCTIHNVPDQWIGVLLYGSYFIHPAPEEAP